MLQNLSQESDMGGKRRTVITIESRRVTVVRSRRPIEMWCTHCNKEVAMFTPEAAAALAGVSPRAIYFAVESGELHFIDTGDGALLICSRSF